MNLSAIDLNLLRIFEALMSERQVTRAGRKLGLSQPAMSNALNRLRFLFKDELLVRGPAGMQPTPRALELEVPIRQALQQIEAVLRAGQGFAPATARRGFAVGFADYAGALLLPALTARLRSAPGIDLRVEPTDGEAAAAAVDAGGLDAALGTFPAPLPRLRQAPLFEESPVCVARRDHPELARGLGLETYLALSHLRVTSQEGPERALAQLLEERGLERRVALSLPQLLLAPEALAGSDLLGTMGERLARRAAERWPLAVWAPPFDLPRFRLSLVWHRRNDNDPAQQWLRETLQSLAATV